MRILILALVANTLSFGQPAEYAQALKLYQNTKYEQAIRLLDKQPDADSLRLTAQSWFMLGEFKKATDVLEKAVAKAPDDASLHLWLGKSWGRRAETSMPLTAPRYATRSREHFEKAVELDPKNIEAMNDLFEYYMQAPGFLGGGKDKAASLADRIASLDAAEGFYTRARLAEDKRDLPRAEEQLRRAAAAAPQSVGRVLDLAKFLAKNGRHQESDAEFKKAAEIAPNSPKVMFERAATYVGTKRNLGEARALLKRYLESPLTPDDPPRHEAEKLLKAMGS